MNKVILTAIDKVIHPQVIQFATRTVEADIETYDFTQDSEPVDTILLLDIIEHLRQPEALLEKLRQQYAHNDPNVIITTGNIGSFVVRFGLLFGQFNYGKRGILDMDHTRLFTFRALRRVLANSGYIVLEEKGIPAPYSLAIGDNLLARFLLVFSKGFLAYQIALVARPRETAARCSYFNPGAVAHL
jgi:hypothetical protein